MDAIAVQKNAGLFKPNAFASTPRIRSPSVRRTAGGLPFASIDILLAPLAHLIQYRVQRLPQLAHFVNNFRRHLIVYRSNDDAVLLQLPKLLGQHFLGNVGYEDEPDWTSDRKMYSPEVESEIERMKRHDALAYIFPIWWYSLPAMLKGYIDRVWNNGFAYGSNKLHHKRVLWLGLAAAP